MKAGKKLDALIAEKIMRYKSTSFKFAGFDLCEVKEGKLRRFSPSTSISDAWEVVEKLGEEFDFNLVKIKGKNSMYMAEFYDGDKFVSSYFADTAPLAVCLSALRTVGFA
jgi:hypothetical protein